MIGWLLKQMQKPEVENWIDRRIEAGVKVAMGHVDARVDGLVAEARNQITHTLGEVRMDIRAQIGEVPEKIEQAISGLPEQISGAVGGLIPDVIERALRDLISLRPGGSGSLPQGGLIPGVDIPGIPVFLTKPETRDDPKG